MYISITLTIVDLTPFNLHKFTQCIIKQVVWSCTFTLDACSFCTSMHCATTFYCLYNVYYSCICRYSILFLYRFICTSTQNTLYKNVDGDKNLLMAQSFDSVKNIIFFFPLKNCTIMIMVMVKCILYGKSELL